jgi:hypothetical protein
MSNIREHESAAARLREVLGLVGRDQERARQRYRRFLDVVGPEYAGRLRAAIAACAGGGKLLDDLPYIEVDDHRFATPVGDALLQITFGKRASVSGLATVAEVGP